MTCGGELASLVFQTCLALLPALNFSSHVAARIFSCAEAKLSVWRGRVVKSPFMEGRGVVVRKGRREGGAVIEGGGGRQLPSGVLSGSCVTCPPPRHFNNAA